MRASPRLAAHDEGAPVTALELFVIVAAAAGAWFLWDSLKAREAANIAMRGACEAEGLFFLDDTVALASVRPARNADGRLAFRRIYEFEFSDTGHNRRDGTIAMLGSAVDVVDLGAITDLPRATLH